MYIKTWLVIICNLIFVVACDRSQHKLITENKDGIFIYNNTVKEVVIKKNVFKEIFKISFYDSLSGNIRGVYDIKYYKSKFYLSDHVSNKIHVFEKNGKYGFSFGCKGDAPGEFRSLKAIGILNDTIFASDFNNKRVSKFLLDGSFQSSVSAKKYLRINSLGSGLLAGIDHTFINDNKYYRNFSIAFLDAKLQETTSVYRCSTSCSITPKGTSINTSIARPVFSVKPDGSGYYLATISDNKYQISYFDSNLIKKYEVNKNYVKKELSVSQIEAIESMCNINNLPNKIVDKYQKSIWALYADNNDQLWVIPAQDNKDSTLLFDKYKHGEYQYSTVINFNKQIISDYTQATMTFLNNNFITVDYQEGEISFYEYK